MALTLFSVVTRTTNQYVTRSPEIVFQDTLVRDSDTVFVDPATSAIDACLAYHKLDVSRNDQAPVLVTCTQVSIIGLADAVGALTVVDLVTGGIGGANQYCYGLTVRPSDNRNAVNGYVYATDKLRNGSATAWSSGTTYSTVGTQVLYSGHNYRSINTGAGTNLNKQPDLNLQTFWKLDDVSSGERAMVGALDQVRDTAWSSGTTYAVGDYASDGSTKLCYRSIQASNLNHALSSTSWWVLVASPVIVQSILVADPFSL